MANSPARSVQSLSSALDHPGLKQPRTKSQNFADLEKIGDKELLSHFHCAYFFSFIFSIFEESP